MKRVGQVILSLLVLGLVLTAACAFFYPEFAKQTRALFFSADQKSPRDASNPEANQTLVEFESCKKYPLASYISIPPERFDEFLSQANIKMSYRLNSDCIKLGEFALGVEQTMAEGATSIFLPRNEKVVVEKIIEESAGEAIDKFGFLKRAIGNIGSQTAEEAKQFLIDHGIKLSEPLYIVSLKGFKNSPLFQGKYEHRFLTHLYFATYIGADEKTDLTQNQGALVIDIRPPQAFNRKHSNDAINIPYIIAPKLRSEYATYEKFFKNDSFSVESIPQDKNKPIIIIGESDSNPIPALRALSTLFILGWKNLYLLRGGESLLEKKWDITPNSIPEVATLDAAQALAANENHVRFVGILDDAFVAEFGKIQNEILDYQDVSEIPENLNQKELNDRGDSFPVEKLGRDKNLPIVFYGKDDYDWRPLKAAIWARDSGFKNVAFFRGGIEEWRGSLVGIQAKVGENAGQK